MVDQPLGLAGLRFRRLHEGTRIRSAVGQPIIDRLYDIWDRRDVLRMLVERGLRHKYANSVLGYAWALLELIQKLKPSTSKGNYMKSIAVSTTMSPSIKIDVNEIQAKFVTE